MILLINTEKSAAGKELAIQNAQPLLFQEYMKESWYCELRFLGQMFVIGKVGRIEEGGGFGSMV